MSAPEPFPLADYDDFTPAEKQQVFLEQLAWSADDALRTLCEHGQYLRVWAIMDGIKPMLPKNLREAA